MTQRLKGVTVAFDRDIREDDAEAILNAIRMIRHVAAVEAVEVNHADWFAQQRVRTELRDAFLKMYDSITGVSPKRGDT